MQAKARGRRGREEPTAAERDLGPAADPESVARSILLAKLTGRARSRQELRDALAAKDVPPELAERLLDRFERVGLVDDRAFADAWVESRHRSRGLSRRALADELRRKGVGTEIAKAAADRIDADAEREAALRLAVGKARSLRGVDEQTAFRRLTGMLARKGYSSGVTISVVREVLGAETDDVTAADPNE
jgi:regulatory protein